MTGLEELALYENRLTGNIPPGITNITKLGKLFLARNNLTGEVPPELGKNNFPGLVKLDFGWNNLSGPIPNELCNGNKLAVLILENNRFNSSFPTFLAKCKSLYRVKLLNNHLHGSIPAELGKLQKLQRLSVSSNRLTGQIPLQLSHCPKLAELDLTNNNLSGRIPKEIASSSALTNLLLQGNKLSGAVPDTFSSTQNLVELQLGNNLLEGPIPCSLGKVPRLSSVLNLSTNMFTGEIPKCLSNLDKLVVLDISRNNLSGAIPSEMDKMMSLSFLNISFNNLSGQIPISWEKLLSSDPASSLRNPGLCLPGTEGSNCKHVKKSSRVKWKVLTGVIIGSVLSVAIIVAAIYLLVARIWHPFLLNKNQLNEWQSSIENLPDGITFEDIVQETEGLSEKHVIGRGKHGTVYKMKAVKSKKQWAVKQVDLTQKTFYDEMRILNLVRHRNLVRLGGYCIKQGYGFILTEYIPGGTLHDVLHRTKPPTVLDWESRHHIALGIAQGISYLHHDLVPQVIHRDIKSDNIMLDYELEPKIGDFGMAKESYSDEYSSKSVIVGTLGYIDPENAYSVQLTEKSDVYRYGVILLELFCRKMPVDGSFEEGLDIVYWVKKNLHRSNSFLCFLDAEIHLWDLEEQWKALKIVDLALQCTLREANTRPAMKDVVKSLIELNHTTI